LENAKKARDDVSQIITELHNSAGFGEYPFIQGVGMGSLSIKPPNPMVNSDAAR